MRRGIETRVPWRRRPVRLIHNCTVPATPDLRVAQGDALWLDPLTISPERFGSPVVPVVQGWRDHVAAAASRPGNRAPPASFKPPYFFSGSGFVCGVPGTLPAPAAFTAPPGVNGNVANIDFAWVCICSCICTNMFFDCSM
ncbi:hypothetical protein ABH945_001416 [Paraburkholderia sp. GAS333]